MGNFWRRHHKTPLNRRFRGFMPVVIDIETGGVDPYKNPLLEIAAVFLKLKGNGLIEKAGEFCDHIEPFEGCVIEDKALEINHIDPGHPLRFARSEKDVMTSLFQEISKELKNNRCKRGILVGHNAHFDLSFINQAIKRCELEDINPLHSFSVLDTVTLGALSCGQTILSLACERSGVAFDSEEAHSAIYDAHKTAELFCTVTNRWMSLGGWDETEKL
ncbi:MAG: ribonuclease T [Gammaproteobacteria bacterium]|nr:ribonuclease T [Gammaproteobacteria bacterium]